jgi:NAD(P)-dependent dehydrogenase (short-subunit alcohol dehydrogenase family)
MDDVLGYEGKRVVVTGAASGMGEQTARLLVELGAEVIALDIKPVSVPVARSMEMTLLEASSIEDAAATIDGPIDSVFSCAGLPGAPFTEIETATANFTGAVHLIEQLVDRMPEDRRSAASHRRRASGGSRSSRRRRSSSRSRASTRGSATSRSTPRRCRSVVIGSRRS